MKCIFARHTLILVFATIGPLFDTSSVAQETFQNTSGDSSLLIPPAPPGRMPPSEAPVYSPIAFEPNAQMFPPGISSERPEPTAPASELEPGATYDSSAAVGAHHRWYVDQDEQGRERRRFMELGTGLNRWDEKSASWLPASVELELFAGGAISRKTAYDLASPHRAMIRPVYSISCYPGGPISPLEGASAGNVWGSP